MPKLWRTTLADMLCKEFISAIEAFRDLVVTPACRALQGIEPPDPENAVLDYEAYLSRLNGLASRKALALALAGLWETQFREHLWISAAVICPGQTIGPKVEAAHIDELEKIFFKVRNFQLSEIAGYENIKGLIIVANAARHGNGNGSRKLYDNYSEYYSKHKPFNGWLSYFTHGGTKHSDVRYLNISEEHLRLFTNAMLDFWKAIVELQKDGSESS